MKNLERFREAATVLKNASIQAWKNKGGGIVGYTCTFLPPEVIHAGGLLPVRLRGLGTTSLALGDTYYSAVSCSVPKCYLQLVAEGKYKFLDGAIITNGCDSMRRLHDNWKEANQDFPGVLPAFFEYLNVPHKAAPHSIDFYRNRLCDLTKNIAAHFEVEITDQSLARSIAIYNEGRRLLKRLDDLRWQSQVPIAGEEAMAILLAAQVMPREEFNVLLGGTIAEMEKALPISDGKKRIMLIGSANDDIEFVKLVEDCGGLVVSDTLCFGARSYAGQVNETGDPLHALSTYYLENNICPRMFGFYPDRIAYIKDLVKKSHVNGAILQNVRFCDLHGSENGVIERDLEEIGIPCIRLEREYGQLSETGRIRMRLDAFMSRLC